MQSPVLSIQFYLIFSHLSTSLQFQQGSSLNAALIPKARYPFNHIEGPTKGGYEPHLSNGIGSPFIQTEITNTVEILVGMANNDYLRSSVSNIISDVSDPYHTELTDALSYPTPTTKSNIDKSKSGGERSIANLGLTNLDGLQGVDMNKMATGVVEISSQPSGIHHNRMKKMNQSATSQFLDVLGRGGVLSERRQNSKPQGSSISITVQSSPHGGVQRLLDQQTANARRALDQQKSLYSPVRSATVNRSPQPQPTFSQHRGRSQTSKLNPKPLALLQFGDQVFRTENSNTSNVKSTQQFTSVLSLLLPNNRTKQQGNPHIQLSNNTSPVEIPITNSTRNTAPRSPPSPQSNILNLISSSWPKTNGHIQLSNNIPPVEIPITNSTRKTAPRSPPSPQSNILNLISSSRPKKHGHIQLSNNIPPVEIPITNSTRNTAPRSPPSPQNNILNLISSSRPKKHGHIQLSNNIPPVEIPITNSTRKTAPRSPLSPQSNILNLISSSRPKTNGQQSTNPRRSVIQNVRVQQSTKNITTQQVTARNKNVPPKTKVSTSEIQRATIQNVPKILYRHPKNPSGTVSNLNKTETANRVMETTGRHSMNEVHMGSARPNHMHQQPNHIIRQPKNPSGTVSNLNKTETANRVTMETTGRHSMNEVHMGSARPNHTNQQRNHIKEVPIRESGLNLIKTQAIYNGQRQPRSRMWNLS